MKKIIMVLLIVLTFSISFADVKEDFKKAIISNLVDTNNLINNKDIQIYNAFDAWFKNIKIDEYQEDTVNYITNKFIVDYNKIQNQKISDFVLNNKDLTLFEIDLVSQIYTKMNTFPVVPLKNQMTPDYFEYLKDDIVSISGNEEAFDGDKQYFIQKNLENVFRNILSDDNYKEYDNTFWANYGVKLNSPEFMMNFEETYSTNRMKTIFYELSNYYGLEKMNNYVKTNNTFEFENEVFNIIKYNNSIYFYNKEKIFKLNENIDEYYMDYFELEKNMLNEIQNYKFDFEISNRTEFNESIINTVLTQKTTKVEAYFIYIENSNLYIENTDKTRYKYDIVSLYKYLDKMEIKTSNKLYVNEKDLKDLSNSYVQDNITEEIESLPLDVISEEVVIEAPVINEEVVKKNNLGLILIVVLVLCIFAFVVFKILVPNKNNEDND